ncbi:MAG TPA: twin-arginine translocase TatA/TatE family subunit [Acidimicrobiales bacterium]|nr:twin-arginine translocase TatA/TatE family subunit [Acidimicrobiales bacterium]
MIANLMGGDGLIVLVIAIVVLLGGSQLPKIARNVGIAGKEFRKAQEEAEDDADRKKQAKAAGETSTVQPPPPQPLPAAPVASVAPAAAPAEPAGTAAGPTPGGAAPGEGTINLTPAQLDALLKAREDQVRGESPGGSN